MDQAAVVDALGALTAVGCILAGAAYPNATINGREKVFVTVQWLTALSNAVSKSTTELTKQIFGNDTEATDAT